MSQVRSQRPQSAVSQGKVKSQQKRIAWISSPLPPDVLVAARLDATEAIGELFEYRLEAISDDAEIDLDSLIGCNMTMSITTPDNTMRHFDGIVVEAHWAGQRFDDNVYRFVLRPWFWLLSQRQDCRIFHQKTAPDIIEEVMRGHDYGFCHFENRLTKSYPTLEYTVQYRESDFAFCRRMMEKHGIVFFFEHEEGKHTLVMADGLSSYRTLDGGAGVGPGLPRTDHRKRSDAFERKANSARLTSGSGIRPFIAKSGREHTDGEHIYALIPHRRFNTGKVALNAYDFKRPKADLKAPAEHTGDYSVSGLEHYDYPGKYVEKGDGQSYAKAQMTAIAARDKRRIVGGELPSAFPGGLMTVIGHPRPSENTEYLILAATHAFATQSYRSGANEEDAYHGTYEVLPSDIDYAPPMTTPKSRVYGPQTAVVVGDGEIDVDEYGRILVRFHWDRLNDQSRRVRVAQSSASQRWGGMVIPRIGMEVIVDFLEGDPDEPIVTGCVYNGKNMPENTLPAYKTRSDFKSDTHQGSGFNQLRFEDENGQQEIFIQAEKYLNGLIKQDETWQVGGSRHRDVGASQSEVIGKDKDMRVLAEHREEIKGNHHATIDGDECGMIGGGSHLTVGGSQVAQVGSSWHTQVGTDIIIEAGVSIVLKAGGNFIKIDPSGISIEGTMVRINCGGAPGPSPKSPKKPDEYKGAHAKRYDRSYKS